MTIAVAVRTGSAVVFATDSKLTARGMTGINPDGTPNWVDQSYDNATKVVHDRSKRLMALGAGTVNVGRTTAIDLIASFNFRDCANRNEEDDAIMELLDHMKALPHATLSFPTVLLRLAQHDEVVAVAHQHAEIGAPLAPHAVEKPQVDVRQQRRDFNPNAHEFPQQRRPVTGGSGSRCSCPPKPAHARLATVPWARAARRFKISRTAPCNL